MNPIGNTWLRDHYQLAGMGLTHESYLGSRLATTHEKDGRTVGIYPRSYALKRGNDPLAHVEFGLKYDGIDLQLLREVFARLPAAGLEQFVRASPTGRYARKIGFLYEFLTRIRLTVEGIGGNYIPLLDPESYIVAPAIKVPRWRVDNNLLGGGEFNPIIRLTGEIKQGIARDWPAEISAVLAGTPPALLYRALSYLYAKETRSSYLIERAEPGRDREQRFIATLRRAGKVPVAAAMTPARLIGLQNVIVDRRYAESGFRQKQNYVGETLPGMKEHVHYISPPPELVGSLMAGLADSTVRMEAIPAVIQAAVTGFQFVFIHPFEDGNGRLHRFLFQDVLARRAVVQAGAALPLSASILDDLHAYDAALEAFSVPVMQRASFALSDTGVLTLNNPRELEGMWRFPDLTPQVEYLFAVMAQAIEALPKELGYLRHYDRAREEIRGIVDIPDQRLGSLLHWLGEGGGRLSINKRKQFAELTDDEIANVQQAYAEAFANEAIS